MVKDPNLTFFQDPSLIVLRDFQMDNDNFIEVEEENENDLLE